MSLEIRPGKLPELPGCEKLAPLECFDPKVFYAPDEDEQEVCNFILMLSLISNDFKDLLWTYNQRDNCRRDTVPPLTAYGGQYGGMRGHVTRLVHSLFFELAGLVKNNSLILEHKLFTETVRQTGKVSKGHWSHLVAFAKGESSAEFKELYKISCLMRNNIAFHYYQPKFLSGGYSHFFSQKDKPANQSAFISRGHTLEATRFYFADAAVEGCFEKYIGREKAGQIRPALNELAMAIAHALYDIVTSFIQLRLLQLKDGYRDYSGATK